MTSQIGEQREHIKDLSNYIFSLPSNRKTIGLSFIVSIAAGLLGYFFLNGAPNPLSALIYGSMMGVFFLWIPAASSGILTAAISTETPRKITYKRSIYLSFFSLCILSVFYVLGCLLPAEGPFNLINLLIYGYVLIFVIRTLALKVTHPYTTVEAIGLGAIHPIAGYVFLYASTYLTFVVTPIPLSISLGAFLFKSIASLSILTIGTVLFFAILNAPMKRNFGVSALELTRSVLGYWLDKSTEIEKIFTEIGEKADVEANVMAFEKNGEMKSMFLVSYLHPGPFKGMGGGKLTGILTEELEEEFETTLFLPHSPSTHDLDPANTDTIYDAINQIKSHMKDMDPEEAKGVTESTRVEVGDVKMLGQVFGDSALTLSTFSPEETDDINSSLGIAVENNLKKDFENSIHVDAHNSYNPGHQVLTLGSTRTYDLLKGSEEIREKLKDLPYSEVKQGIAVKGKESFAEEKEVGETSVRASVIEVNGQRTAYVVASGNNMVKGLREKTLKELEDLDIDQAEVMTTDTHSVNSIRTDETPIGSTVDEDKFTDIVKSAVEEAINDLEPVKVKVYPFKLQGIDVMGPDIEPELVSTINSTIATTKIAGPIIFGSSLILSLAAVVI